MEKNMLKEEIKIILLSEEPPSLVLCKGELTCTATSFEPSILSPQVQIF